LHLLDIRGRQQHHLAGNEIDRNALFLLTPDAGTKGKGAFYSFLLFCYLQSIF